MSLASHNPQDEPAVMSRRLRNYFVLKDFRKYTRSSVAATVAHIRLSLADSCCETIRSPSARSSPETLGLYPRTPSRWLASALLFSGGRSTSFALINDDTSQSMFEPIPCRTSRKLRKECKNQIYETSRQQNVNDSVYAPRTTLSGFIFGSHTIYQDFTTIMPVPSTSTTKNRVLLTIEPQKPHPLLTTSNEPLALCGGQDIDILTAFDSVWGGVNDWLAGLVSGRQSDQRAFIPDTIRDEGGEGKRVELEKPVEMSELVSRTKTGLGLSSKVMQTTEAHVAMFTLGGS
ncbi:hypothetical protein C8F01DRAFT_1085885 [Mycena amicta]|nr:hypothetical protein C8F01DRAFT_1085885 [Mycena amicta]